MAARGSLKVSGDNDNDDSSSSSSSGSESSSSSDSDQSGRRSGSKSSESGTKELAPVSRPRQSSVSICDDDDDETLDTRRKDQPPAIVLDVGVHDKLKFVPKVWAHDNKAGEFVTGFDPTSMESQENRDKRVKRFGASLEQPSFTEEAVNHLFDVLGISRSEAENAEKGIRLEAIFINGVDRMSTEKVFAYFQEFPPSSIEWIDDSSCNVVWLDKVTATRALLKLTRDPEEPVPTLGGNNAPVENIETIKGNEPEKMEEEDDDLDLLSDDDIAKLADTSLAVTRKKTAATVSSAAKVSTKEAKMDVDDDSGEEDSSQEKKLKSKKKAIIPITFEANDGEGGESGVPPGRWRIGLLDSNSHRILYMRFATKEDKKMPGAGKRSMYYRNYGNPNFDGMKGLISQSRKHKIFSRRNEEDSRDAREAVREHEWRRGIPEETSFDEHLRRELERVGATTTSRDREKVHYDDLSELEESASNPPSPSSCDPEPASPERGVVEPEDAELKRLLEPPESKRRMRMHADTEEKPLSQRLGKHIKLSTRVTSVLRGTTDTRDRLGHRTRPTDHPPRHTDLRQRLGARREEGGRSSHHSQKHSRSTTTKPEYEEDEDDDDDRASPRLFSTISKPRLCIEVIND